MLLEKEEEIKEVGGELEGLMIYASISANVSPAISISEAEDQRERGPMEDLWLDLTAPALWRHSVWGGAGPEFKSSLPPNCQ